jgi:hypothetical protein
MCDHNLFQNQDIRAVYLKGREELSIGAPGEETPSSRIFNPSAFSSANFTFIRCVPVCNGHRRTVKLLLTCDVRMFELPKSLQEIHYVSDSSREQTATESTRTILFQVSFAVRNINMTAACQLQLVPHTESVKCAGLSV